MTTTGGGRDILSLVGGLYEAAVVPSAWDSAWTAVVRHFDGSSATLFVDAANGVTPIAFPGFSASAISLYASHYNRLDPWLCVVARQSIGRVTPADRFVPASQFEASETWQDFSRPHVGAFHALIGGVSLSDRAAAMFGIHRAKSRPAFDVRDGAQFDLMLPHLRNAILLTRRLAEATAATSAGFAALHAIASAAIVVEGDGTIIFANRAAEASMATGPLVIARMAGAPGTGQARLTLATATSRQTDTLLRLIASAARGAAGGALLLTTEAGQSHVQLRIMPLPDTLAESGPFAKATSMNVSGRALVLARDLRVPEPLPTDTLIALYGLTDTEAVVAQALLGGATAEQVATRRHVSLATIRAQIRSLLEKTGARNLRDLERFIMNA